MKKIVTLSLLAYQLLACSHHPANEPEDPIAAALSRIPSLGEMNLPDREQYENCDEYKTALAIKGYPSTATTDTHITSELANGMTMTFNYPRGGCR